MENNQNIDDALDLDIDDLFRDPDENNDEPTEQNTSNGNEPSEETKAVSERINIVKRKTQTETRDEVAKEFGYANYAEMQKAKEKQMLRDKGLDEEETAALVEQLVEKRFANDPRFKRLEEIEANEKTNFVNAQLKEINKLTGDNFTDVKDLPDDTLKLWEKTGNLKQAYLATHGEELLNKRAAGRASGSLEHLGTASMTGNSTKTRGLSDEEKSIWKSVLGDYITDDELNKKTTLMN